MSVGPRKFFFMMEILIRVSIDEKKMNWPKKNLKLIFSFLHIQTNFRGQLKKVIQPRGHVRFGSKFFCHYSSWSYQKFSDDRILI
jgi:hypothetical protein